MATKKKENIKKNEGEENKNLKYIDVLNDFREGVFVDFPSFLERKSIEEIMVILDKLFIKLALFKSQYKDVQYEVEKQRLIFFDGLLQCTSLEINEEEKIFKNMDFDFEDLVYKNSSSVRKLYSMISNISFNLDLQVIKELTEEFKNIPDAKELESLEKGLDDIFSKRSSKDLKMIESILEFNDPNLKAIKDIVMAPTIENKKELTKNGNNITERKKV